MIFLDTHVVVWLYEGRIELFPQSVKKIINDNDLLISPMVTLELKYLNENKHISGEPHAIISDLENRIGLQTANTPFHDIIINAMEIHWTRDPFDRIITAHTLTEQSRLITADTNIRENFTSALW